MKKLFVLLAVLPLLTGCGKMPAEYVRDVLPRGEVPCWQEEAYTISLGLPEGTQDLGNGCYSMDDGAVKIETRRFLTSGMEQAVKSVSGLKAEQLTILETTRFDLPEYQFAWYEENGQRLCRADVVLDGMTCYAVLCSRPEAAGPRYEKQLRQVFSSFGLYTDEGV